MTMLTTGHGKNIEEARKDLQRNKLAQIPVFDDLVPAQSADDFDEVVGGLMRRVLDLLIGINTIALKPPAGLSEEYIETVRTAVYEMYMSGQPVWESTYPEATPDGSRTMNGELMRMQRQGGSLKEATFTVLLPGDPGYDEAVARVEAKKKTP
jgi:hypothetical protein